MAIHEIDACNKSDSSARVAIVALKVKINRDSTNAAIAIMSLQKKITDNQNRISEQDKIIQMKEDEIVVLRKRPKKLKVLGIGVGSGIIGGILAIIGVVVL